MHRASGTLIAALVLSLVMAHALWATDAKPAEKKPGVVAVVNGSEVPMDDFFRELLRLERLVLNTGRILTCPQITRLRTEVAEGLVRRELLYQESKSKVKVTDAEIATRAEEAQGPVCEREGFRRLL